MSDLPVARRIVTGIPIEPKNWRERLHNWYQKVVDDFNAELQKKSGKPALVERGYPYYHNDLCETIHDAQEDVIVQEVLKMSFEQINLLQAEVDTKKVLDPNFHGSREHVLKYKSGHLRALQLKKAGKFEPTLDPVTKLGIIAGSWVVGGMLYNKFHDYTRREGSYAIRPPT